MQVPSPHSPTYLRTHTVHYRTHATTLCLSESINLLAINYLRQFRSGGAEWRRVEICGWQRKFCRSFTGALHSRNIHFAHSHTIVHMYVHHSYFDIVMLYMAEWKTLGNSGFTISQVLYAPYSGNHTKSDCLRRVPTILDLYSSGFTCCQFVGIVDSGDR